MSRAAAEASAKRIADERQTKGSGRRMVEGKQFAAIGGFDENGPWHFALDYETPEDRSDVKAWLETLR